MSNPALVGSGAHGLNRLCTPDNLAAQLAVQRSRLEAIETVFDWRVDLISRIRRAQLRFELCDISTDEIDIIADELRDYIRICRALAWIQPAP